MSRSSLRNGLGGLRYEGTEMNLKAMAERLDVLEQRLGPAQPTRILIRYVEPGGHTVNFDDPDEDDDERIVRTDKDGNRYKLTAAEKRAEREHERAEMLANPPTGPVQIFSSDLLTAAELEAWGADRVAPGFGEVNDTLPPADGK